MKKLYALPLAALAFTAACDDSSNGLFSPEAGGPNFHHRNAPTTVSVAVSGQDVTVSWSAVSGNAGYGVQIASCPDATCSNVQPGPGVDVSGTTTSYTQRGLAAGTYYARVNAHNGGEGGDNNTIKWSSWNGFSVAPSTSSPPSSTPTDERVTQSIENFSMPTNVVYGDHNQTFSPTATSGLAVTLTASGQCTLVDSSNNPVSSAIAPASVKITGAGVCEVTATQAGTAPYTGFHRASVTDEFAIAQKELTVTARNESKDYDGSVFSGGYSNTIAGFVNGDREADVVSGSVTYTGAAMTAVNAGSHTITPVVSGLSATNYSFTPVNGTLTINKVNATISVQGYTGIFDNSAHGATGSATGVNGENLNSLLNLGDSFTAVPGGTANWTFAGNTNYNSANGSVSIVISAWTNRGFYSPVRMGADVVNTVKAGSTVPLKFNVFAGTVEQTSTGAVKGFHTTKVVCESGAIEETVDITTTGGTSLRYDATAGQFVQNWQTPKTAGCYRAIMTTLDGSTIVANFKTR